MKNITIIAIVFTIVAIGIGTLYSSGRSLHLPIDKEAIRIIEEIQSDNEPNEFYFEDYPLTKKVYEGDTVAVDLSSYSLAEGSEEKIRSGLVQNGINFAGKYSVVTRGCGENCQLSTIVDVSLGGIVEYGIISIHGLSYSRDSTLFIVNPETNIPIDVEATSSVETDFYSLTRDGTLRHLLKRIVGEEDLDGCVQVVVAAQNPFTGEIKEFGTPCSVPFGWRTPSVGTENTL